MYGGARELMAVRDFEVCLDGPAGTGKTLAAWWKVHLALLKYPGARALALRKSHASLVSTALVIYRKEVLHPALGVRFFGGNSEKPPMYIYPNGSEMLLGGLDRPGKVMSSAYDLIYVNEANDLKIDEYELPFTRLRNGVMPYQQLISDVNPQNPKHWLNRRMDSGLTRRILSRHEDNPKYWDHQNKRLTPVGEAYINGILGNLTGVRRLRLKDGKWVAAEGAIYENDWDEARNVITPFPVPREWPRFLSIDFGFVHPFVCQFWAVDNDGRLYLTKEIYHTKRTVKDHCLHIKRAAGWHEDKKGAAMLTEQGMPLPYAVIADHDAEDRATLEEELGLTTTPATKNVSTGIQKVQERMRPAGDGKPRLFIFSDALYERDLERDEHELPCCTKDEIETYMWLDSARRDEPVKELDDGCDAMRYMVAHRDLDHSGVQYIEDIWSR
jgi:hypothetical protein